MNNYPWNQALMSQKAQPKPVAANPLTASKFQFKAAPKMAMPASSISNSAVQSFMMSGKEQPFGRLASSNESSASYQKNHLAAIRKPNLITPGQNGAILANSSRLNYSGHNQASKIDYQDSFGRSSRVAQQGRQQTAQESNVLNRYRQTPNASRIITTTTTPPPQSVNVEPISKDRMLYDRLMNQANSSEDDVEIVEPKQPTMSIFERYRLNSGNKQSSVAQAVYKGNGSRQMQALTKKPQRDSSSFQNTKERQSDSLYVPKPQLVQQQTRPNQFTGRQNQVTVEANGQEMIELDDDNSSIAMSDLEAALAYEKPSPQRQSSHSRSSLPRPAGQTTTDLLKKRVNKNVESNGYGQMFDQIYKNARTSNLVAPMQKLKAMQQSKPLQPRAASAIPQQKVPSRYGSTSTFASGKVNVISNDPLQSGVIHDSTTKRLVQRKRREMEEKSKQDKEAELRQKLAQLEKEKQKRLKRAARKEEDELADILGMPKSHKKSKPKKECDFDFLDRDQAQVNALLIGDDKAFGDVEMTIEEKVDQELDFEGRALDGAQRQANRELKILQEANRQAERRQREAEEQAQRQAEKKAKMRRFHERNRVDELIKPILSLELVQQFYETDPTGRDLGQIPMRFENHQQYMDCWIPLFLFETYNQMISQKSVSQHDRAIAELLGTSDRMNREFNFMAIIEQARSDFDYHHLKLVDADNINGKDFGKGYLEFPSLQKLRENDLILLSEEPLEGVDQGKPVKKICNAEFLLKMAKQEKSGLFLACVTRSRQKDQNNVEIRADYAFVDSYFRDNKLRIFTDRQKLHCYYFDSLTTIVREFQTIKKSEFYATHDIILDPVDALQKIQAKKKLDKKGNSDMLSFIQRNDEKFNPSQKEALSKVASMHKKDLLLVQGPPGTGKTHTIHGIISMLNCCTSKKILVCAPSNAAIDEIVSRIISNQFSMQTRDKVLRIGAMEYEPAEGVKRVTLDYKLEVEVEKQLARGIKHSEVGAAGGAISPQGSAQPSQSASAKKGAGPTPSRVNMNSSEKKAAYNAIKKAQLQLQRQEHTTESLQKLLQGIFAVPSQLQHFLNIQSRTQKIDTLEAMRKELDPKPKGSLLGNVNKPSAPPTRANQSQYLTQKQRRNLMLNIMKQAQIVCTTLAMSASEMFNNFSLDDFDYLIVDEACQSVELTNLIPFQHEPNKVILVGDQQQLPATVFSENGNETRYSRSMFERFLQCGVENYMLCIQYRMHPKIRQFPSAQFYSGKLEDAHTVLNRTLDKALSDAQGTLKLEPSMFFDLAYSKESQAETSKQNPAEVNFIVELLFVIAKATTQNQYNESDLSTMKGRIGIISPYKSQVRQIKMAIRRVQQKLCLSTFNDIEVNTVDAYQGREKDIIIISTVRTDGIGFLRDYRRMNVAITRAKHFLMVVGNKNCLERDRNWKAFVQEGCQQSYSFTESYFSKDKGGQQQSGHNPSAQGLIERTLKFQKVQYLPKASSQQKPQVPYNDIFSPTSSVKKPIEASNPVTSNSKHPSSNKIVPGKFNVDTAIVEKGVTFAKDLTQQSNHNSKRDHRRDRSRSNDRQPQQHFNGHRSVQDNNNQHRKPHEHRRYNNHGSHGNNDRDGGHKRSYQQRSGDRRQDDFSPIGSNGSKNTNQSHRKRHRQ